MNLTGRDVRAMTFNGSIPGPTLRFREGDTARIKVHNRLDVPTSIHWHGILLPNRQDGVPFVNNPPIKPGATVHFEFPLIQSGTYWFHSHTDLQEQRGVYGAIVITPREGERIAADRDEVVVLSDWTDEDPDAILRALKSGNDYQGYKKGTVQSLVGAAQSGALMQALRRGLRRMPPMDLSDVAYDRFLANGRPEHPIPAEPGDTVRLRFINAAASTYFHLQFAGGPVTIVAADGIETQPLTGDRFLMAIAETYDVLVTVPPGGAHELRATAQDGSGHTSVFIGRGPRVAAPAVPRPDLYKMHGSMHGHAMKKNQPSQNRHGTMPEDKMQGMHHSRSMPAMKATHARPVHEPRPGTPYARLRSLRPTELPPNNPVREVTLTLTGDMERYIWSIDDEVIGPDNTIRIRHGENVRFILVNKTMMHHPMHLHGHFFRLLNGGGAHAPLKHTVDVPPMSQRIIEFEANDYKDWFFHCHVLYHAKSGMARVIHYEDIVTDAELQAIRPLLFKDPWYAWVDGTIQSHMTDGAAVAANSKNILSAHWEVGWQDVEGTEHDVELAYDRYFTRFFTAFAGVNLTDEYERGIFGVRYLLPFNFESQWRIDTAGELRVSIGQSLRLTERFGVFGEFEYDTESKKEWVAGGDVWINKNWSLIGQYHSDFGGGAGLRFRF